MLAIEPRRARCGSAELGQPGETSVSANYKTVFIPTNLDVKPPVKTRFAVFYAALFDLTIAAHPGAVVTEYAWTAVSSYHCDLAPRGKLELASVIDRDVPEIGLRKAGAAKRPGAKVARPPDRRLQGLGLGALLGVLVLGATLVLRRRR